MSVKDDLYQAIEIIADSKIAKLKFDKTVEAVISSVVNIDTGEYKVSYEGNTFVAFASDLTIEYELNDSVYLKIPEGDLSNKKMIEGKVTSASISASKKDSLTQAKIYQGPEISTLYNLSSWLSDEEDYGVAAGADESHEPGQLMLFTTENAENETFKLYANKYNHMEISADFMAEFLDWHDYGDYGLEIKFSVSEEGIKNEYSGIYYLDITAFNGQPYDFPSPSPQSVIIKYPLNYLTGIEYIKLFQKGFIKGQAENNPKEIDQPNIFVYNISMKFVEIKDLSIAPYYLYISSPSGLDIKNGLVTLEPNFLYYGKDISSHAACKYFWCIENPTITVQNELYNKNFGVGWQQIETGDNIYIENNKLCLKSNAFNLQQKNFKLVAIYNGEIAQSTTIAVFNSVSIQPIYALTQVQEIEETWLKVCQDKQPVTDFNGRVSWYIKKPDGIYELIADNADASFNITQYLTYSSVMFTCAFDDYILYYSLVQPESEDEVQVIFEGSQLFHYDTLGNLDVSMVDEEYFITANIIWKEECGTTYKLRWLDPNGNEITKEKHSPENSLIEKLYLTETGIGFTVANKFLLEKSGNNILTLQIITLNGEVFEFKNPLNFIKDGDQGSNGTAYSCIIYPCIQNGSTYESLPSGFYPLDYSELQRTQSYMVKVYKDGIEIPSAQMEKCRVSWSTFSQGPFTTSSADGKQVCRIALKDSAVTSDIMQYSVLKVAVDVDFDAGLLDALSQAEKKYETTPNEENRVALERAQAAYDESKTSSSFGTTITYNLPIPIATFDYRKESLNEYWLPQYVKYSSAGYDPIFIDKLIKFLYNGDRWNIQSLSENLCSIYFLQLRDEEGNYLYDEDGNPVYDTNDCRLRPANRFMYDCGTAIISITNPNNTNEIIYSPIMMYLDTYGNEAINGWDGTSISLGKDENGNDTGAILAPQVGAGIKNSDNTFSGVIMGSVQQGTKFSRGLYGFEKGIGTFGLEAENGDAWFGQGKMIEITANKGIIRGNAPELTSKTHHMQLDLFDTRGDAKAIHIYSGNDSDAATKENGKSKFYITYGGACYLKGTIDALEGTIAGWQIDDKSLSYESSEEKIKFYFGYLQSGMPGVSDAGKAGLGLIFSSKTEAVGSVKITKSNTGMSYKNGYITISNAINSSTSQSGLQINMGTGNDGGFVIAEADIITDFIGANQLDKTSSQKDWNYLWTNIPASHQFGIYARFA